MTRIRSSSTSGESPIMEFIKKYAILLIGIALGFPYILRYYKDSMTKDEENNAIENEKVLVVKASNPTTLSTALNKITTRTDIQSIARNVAFHLGTNVQVKNADWTSWFNPRGWTENDSEAFKELKKINYPASKVLVVKCYYVITRRNLDDDVNKLLDSELKKQLPLFK